MLFLCKGCVYHKQRLKNIDKTKKIDIFQYKYFVIQKIFTIFAPRKAITLHFVTSKVKTKLKIH